MFLVQDKIIKFMLNNKNIIFAYLTFGIEILSNQRKKHKHI